MKWDKTKNKTATTTKEVRQNKQYTFYLMELMKRHNEGRGLSLNFLIQLSGGRGRSSIAKRVAADLSHRMRSCHTIFAADL